MHHSILQRQTEPPIATLALNDPHKRNALSLPMFDALEAALHQIQSDNSIHILLLRGEGPAFCAGFDLAAAVNDPPLIAQYIQRLSLLLRTLRRVPQIVVAAVHGPAIAGGCAILSACDFVVAAEDATLGYPVHRLGISPAVTIPTLHQSIGPGQARSLLLEGKLISASQVHRLGLATHLAPSASAALIEAKSLCNGLANKGAQALRATKAWLNELDGSMNDANFDFPASASAAITQAAEARNLLASWSARS